MSTHNPKEPGWLRTAVVELSDAIVRHDRSVFARYKCEAVYEEIVGEFEKGCEVWRTAGFGFQLEGGRTTDVTEEDVSYEGDCRGARNCWGAVCSFWDRGERGWPSVSIVATETRGEVSIIDVDLRMAG